MLMCIFFIEFDYRADRIGTAMAWGLRSQVGIILRQIIISSQAKKNKHKLTFTAWFLSRTEISPRF